MGASDSKSSWSMALGKHWVSDQARATCFHCSAQFTWRLRRHHCRCCGELFCSTCCKERLIPTWATPPPLQTTPPTPQLLCEACAVVVTHVIAGLADGTGVLLGLTECTIQPTSASETAVAVVMDSSTSVFKVTLHNWKPFTKATALRFERVAAASAPNYAGPVSLAVISIGDDDDDRSSVVSAGTNASSAIDKGKRSLKAQMDKRKEAGAMISRRAFKQGDNSISSASMIAPASAAPPLRSDDLPVRFDILLASMFLVRPSADGATLSLSTRSEVLRLAPASQISPAMVPSDSEGVTLETLITSVLKLVDVSRVRSKVRVGRHQEPRTERPRSTSFAKEGYRGGKS